jgi:hypothetical protein
MVEREERSNSFLSFVLRKDLGASKDSELVKRRRREDLGLSELVKRG